ncbi:MAG: MBL fold metallo-hydrolase, partial [Thermoplasmata archaeon]
MDITFLGATRTVTGSCYLLHHRNSNILIDCGLYQGRKELTKRNYLGFAFRPADIDAVVLTHAHIDHSGLIPRLCMLGFKGKIYSTSATKDLCEILFQDNGKLQEEDAKRINRQRLREGLPLIEPLYTREDAVEAMRYFSPVPYNTGQDTDVLPSDETSIKKSSSAPTNTEASPQYSPSPALRIPRWMPEGLTPRKLSRAGSPSGWREENKRKLIISGDIGKLHAPVVRDPSLFKEADYVLVESTYGNREHGDEEIDVLISIIRRAVAEKGKIIIPAFSVGRTQDILYVLNDLVEHKRIPSIPVFLDSPLAIKATDIFKKHTECYDEETLALLANRDEPFDFPRLSLTRAQTESMEINNYDGAALIIAGSGMCEGGRVLHHLKHHIWKENTAIVFVGYQAEGTLGRKIQDGERYVDILGDRCKVNARVYTLTSFSAHADSKQLHRWASSF